MKHLVKVIIPFYKETLSCMEQKALSHNMAVLPKYPVVFLKPENMDLEEVHAEYPRAEVMNVSSDWLGKKRGIQGYNEMMMSKDFYDMFSDCEYIMICHTDAWIFRDEVFEWCKKGYDLVAAPWPLRPRYSHFPFNFFVRTRQWLAGRNGEISWYSYAGKVGNGGLSLRRVSAFRVACEKYDDVIAGFKDRGINEDVFWALFPEGFIYPSMTEALKFAYDVKPGLCHKLNHRNLPMGCHAFMHRSRMKFWQNYIPLVKAESRMNLSVGK